jgi:hypothetical protein
MLVYLYHLIIMHCAYVLKRHAYVFVCITCKAKYQMVAMLFGVTHSHPKRFRIMGVLLFELVPGFPGLTLP